MVIRLGRNGRFLACSLYPGAQGVAAAAGGGARDGGAGGRGRDLSPAAARGRWSRSAAGSAPSWAAPGIPTAATSTRTARRHPSSCRSRSPARPARRATSSPGARGAPGACSSAARATRSAASPPRASRWARSMTPMAAPWPATRTGPRCASPAARPSRCPTTSRSASRSRAGSPTRARWRPRPAGAGVRVARGATKGRAGGNRRGRDQDPARGQAGGVTPTPGPRRRSITDRAALEGFVTALTARVAHPTPAGPTRPSVTRAARPPRARRARDWRAPTRRQLRAWLASTRRPTGWRQATMASRLAAHAAFYRHAQRDGLGRGRSVRGHHHAQAAAPSAAGARARTRSRHSSTRCGGSRAGRGARAA